MLFQGRFSYRISNIINKSRWCRCRSHITISRLIYLIITQCKKLKFHCVSSVLLWHNINTKFHENPSASLQFETMGRYVHERAHTHTHAHARTHTHTHIYGARDVPISARRKKGTYKHATASLLEN